MQEAVKQLLSLQERDLELDRLQGELAAIPKEIAAINKRIEAERAALEDSKKELTQLQMQRKEKEVDLSAKEDAVRKHTAELNAIKSNDAYRAMLGEIEKAKQEKSTLEDEILQLMDKVDQSQRAWKERETAAKTTETERQRQIADWDSKQKNLEEQIALKQKSRDELAAAYTPSLVETYLRLRQGKQVAVIVPIKAEQCSGCHMKVSHNLINEVKRGMSLMACEHCFRLVYLEEDAEKPITR
ncbi:MAG: hypothetical protein A2992_08415 [Elusimicrobia bacterium RIFCSPLOWO2_01_FULL_59_12]|nr:MAG: hypothetical protein A2992_08415 [Elusimicrobia bacterium RIFCSPLOWO2_01_FULL_59_12]